MELSKGNRGGKHIQLSVDEALKLIGELSKAVAAAKYTVIPFTMPAIDNEEEGKSYTSKVTFVVEMSE